MITKNCGCIHNPNPGKTYLFLLSMGEESISTAEKYKILSTCFEHNHNEHTRQIPRYQSDIARIILSVLTRPTRFSDRDPIEINQPPERINCN